MGPTNGGSTELGLSGHMDSGKPSDSVNQLRRLRQTLLRRDGVPLDDRSDTAREFMWLAFRPPTWIARRAFLERHGCIFLAFNNRRASTFAAPCVKARVRPCRVRTSSLLYKPRATLAWLLTTNTSLAYLTASIAPS
jgi:hypothetical protein